METKTETVRRLTQEFQTLSEDPKVKRYLEVSKQLKQLAKDIKIDTQNKVEAECKQQLIPLLNKVLANTRKARIKYPNGCMLALYASDWDMNDVVEVDETLLDQIANVISTHLKGLAGLYGQNICLDLLHYGEQAYALGEVDDNDLETRIGTTYLRFSVDKNEQVTDIWFDPSMDFILPK